MRKRSIWLANWTVPALRQARYSAASRRLGFLKGQHKPVVLVAFFEDVEVAGILRPAQHVAFFTQRKTCAGDFFDYQQLIDAMERFRRFVAGALLGRMIHHAENAAAL